MRVQASWLAGFPQGGNRRLGWAPNTPCVPGLCRTDTTDSGRRPSPPTAPSSAQEGALSTWPAGSRQEEGGCAWQRSHKTDSASACTQHSPAGGPRSCTCILSPGGHGQTEARLGKSHVGASFLKLVHVQSLALPEHGLGQAPCHCCMNHWPQEHWVPFRAALHRATQTPASGGLCPSQRGAALHTVLPTLPQQPQGLQGSDLLLHTLVPLGNTPEDCGATDPRGEPCCPASPGDTAGVSASLPGPCRGSGAQWTVAGMLREGWRLPAGTPTPLPALQPRGTSLGHRREKRVQKWPAWRRQPLTPASTHCYCPGFCRTPGHLFKRFLVDF